MKRVQGWYHPADIGPRYSNTWLSGQLLYMLTIMALVIMVSFSVGAAVNTDTTNCKTGVPAPNLNLLFSADDYYHSYPNCFGQLPFDQGEFLALSPPSPAFASLYVPAHKGLIRVGAIYEYEYTRDAVVKQMQTSISTRFARDMTLYANLLMADIHKDAINQEQFRQYDNQLPQNQHRTLTSLHKVALKPNNIEFYPRWYLETLIKHLLSVEGANQYQ